MRLPLLLLFAVLPCAACAVPREAGFPDVQRTVEARLGERIHWDQGGEADAAVHARVREMLGREIAPAEAVQIALLGNRGLQAAYEELMVAQADVVQAGLLKNPSLSGALGFSFGTPHLTPSYDLGVELDFLGLLLVPARRRVASASFEAVKLRVGAEVLRVAHETRVAYVTLQGAQQVAEMRRAIAGAAEASMELAGRAQAAGNISELDLANEQGLYEDVRLDLARSEAEITAARERLGRLMGGLDEGRWSVAPRLAELPAADPPIEHVEALAVEQRLEVGAARRELEAAGHALAMAEDFRALGGATVGASLQRDPEGNRVAGPTASLELPIFDQKQAAIARLRAQRRQAELRLEGLLVDVRSEAREARSRLALARAVVERYRTVVVPLRERIVRLSQSHYDAMLLGVYQLLLAKRSEVNAYREYIEAVRAYWVARSELSRALGGRLTAAPVAPPVAPPPASVQEHP